jgi:DNA replication protein DnaC
MNGDDMLKQETLDKMHAMKMHATAEAFEHQLGSNQWADLSFEDRVGMLVDAEWTSREQRKLSRRLQAARLRYPASLEDVDFKAPRGLDRQVVLGLASCGWIREHQNVILVGSTGIGKSYLACALAERACRSGYSACYVRAPRLLQDLAVARGDGSYGRLLAKIAKTDLLAIDDWMLHPLKDSERRDLLEVIEDRYGRTSTLVATQIPVKSWHEAVGEPTLADAICDRLIHGAHRIELKGSSMRDPEAVAKRTRKAPA